MSRFIVAYEGRDTADNRHIEVGALSPRSSRIPIFLDFDVQNSIGWAQEFQRMLNGDTGWTEISFECYFNGKNEDKVRQEKLTPTCTMGSVVGRTPYETPDQALAAAAGNKLMIGKAEITSVSFTVGVNAWGEYPK